MNLLICGGGSGGHITPNIAVAKQLKKLSPDCRITYIIEKNCRFRGLLNGHDELDQIIEISAGKLRRYHGDTWLKKITDVKTIYLNTVDAFKVLRGIIQAWKIIGKLRPEAIFIKGGFVGLPVGLAARLRGVPFITHDSDARAGLTNRVIGRWATNNIVGFENGKYPYKKESIITLGVPVSREFKPVGKIQALGYKVRLGLPKDSKLLLITGGSLGAKRMNDGLASIVLRLIEAIPGLVVVHQIGSNATPNYDISNKPEQLILKEFIEDMPTFTGAADLIIARGGATQIAELAIQAKPVIIIPNPELTGGHQLDNAKVLRQNNAAIIISEVDLLEEQGRGAVYEKIEKLLNDKTKQNVLSKNIAKLARPNATEQISEAIIKLAKRRVS